MVWRLLLWRRIPGQQVFRLRHLLLRRTGEDLRRAVLRQCLWGQGQVHLQGRTLVHRRFQQRAKKRVGHLGLRKRQQIHRRVGERPATRNRYYVLGWRRREEAGRVENGEAHSVAEQTHQGKWRKQQDFVELELIPLNQSNYKLGWRPTLFWHIIRIPFILKLFVTGSNVCSLSRCKMTNKSLLGKPFRKLYSKKILLDCRLSRRNYFLESILLSVALMKISFQFDRL